jgi:hypothetical protein
MDFIKIILVLILFTAIWSCQKQEDEEYVNPYDLIENPDPVNIDTTALDPKSLPGLHSDIFAKTCANSGCHDGTFEPDFRTIESTYNTLVNHPIIKNDPQGSFSFRVVPGNTDQSQLIARLTYDIDGNSGVMPLVIEPDSDWEERKDEYIQNIKDWIAAGAPRPF